MLIDIHRHLEGCAGPAFVSRLEREGKIDSYEAGILKEGLDLSGFPPSFLNFQARFRYARRLLCDIARIRELCGSVLQELQSEKVELAEIRFSPAFFSLSTGHSPEECTEVIFDAFKTKKLRVDFALTLSRHTDEEINAMSVRCLQRYRDRFRALDIAGVEFYSALPYEKYVQMARGFGMKLTLHCAEFMPAEMTLEEVRQFKPERIGHGVKILLNDALRKEIAEFNPLFEICPTSNVMTGAIRHIEELPITVLVEENIPFCINTDDPGLFQTTAISEYSRVLSTFGIPQNQLDKSIVQARSLYLK